MDEMAVLARLAHALFLSGLIGLEREQRDRPAGLRTHLLVSLASATFTIVSIDFVRFQPPGPDGMALRTDPARIAAYVVAGLGFLGAGTIIRSGSDIKGLTTAATIWMVSSIGMASGAGMYGLAWISTAAALAVLLGMRQIELMMDEHRDHPCARMLEVRLSEPGVRARVGQVLVELGVHAARELVDHRLDTGELLLRYEVRCREVGKIEEIWERLRGMPGVVRVVIAGTEAGASDGGVSLV